MLGTKVRQVPGEQYGEISEVILFFYEPLDPLTAIALNASSDEISVNVGDTGITTPILGHSTTPVSPNPIPNLTWSV